ncbi:MAG TPA: sugar ABC transporter ATP-binding protein [Chloroflexota bacterium]|nr:sugar ABC transporter ATP-binding protein [Chloroflexota bacterium]
MAAAIGPHIVKLDGISKRFGSTRALSDVSLSIEAGEIHALVGENGAGKSTLGKIIGGVYTPDRGRLTVAGVASGGWSTKQALAAGVATIQQELSLVPALSVAENVFLGVEGHRFGLLKGDLRERFAALQAASGFDLDPDARVDSLRIADQQKVEILRALARDARLIIMDEPASSLTADETAKLHDVMHALQRAGRTIIYVTHFLDAVLEHCHRVSVLRDGRLIRTASTDGETTDSLVEAMLGRSMEVAFPPLPPAPAPTTAPALALRDVWSGSAVRGVSLEVRPGEIAGLAGLVGSGRTEVARVIYGAGRLDAGEILLGGRPYHHPAPRRSTRMKLVMIPEDRRRQGLILTQRVGENVSLPHLRKLSWGGFVSGGREQALAQVMIQRLDINPPRAGHPVATLSGGNQQKVLFAKWMVDNPQVILLDEPTRGVDVGAKQHIYRIIVELAAAGAAILLISSELEEVMGLCHRVYLIREGRIIQEVSPALTTVDEVLFSLFDTREKPADSAGTDRPA